MGHQFAALSGIDIRPPAGGPVHISGEIGRAFVGRIHFAGKGPEFGKRDIGCPALGARLFVAACGRELRRAFSGQLAGENIRGGVQVILGMPANKDFVLGECNVALKNSCAHPRCRQIAFHGMLGELHRSAPMTDGKQCPPDRLSSASQEFCFQVAILHPVDESKWARTDGHRA